MTDTAKTCKAGMPALFFLTGAVVGTGIALLTASKTGRESRDYLKGLYNDAEAKAKGYAKDYYEKGKEWLDELPAKVKHVVTRHETAHA